mmetsp:Transcript_70071/g.110658  ORF Transcript_70071/g.110658 Transcript_70071/m.110658 type:complete len:290 (+) Transcript_70071:24-893(+)
MQQKESSRRQRKNMLAHNRHCESHKAGAIQKKTRVRPAYTDIANTTNLMEFAPFQCSSAHSSSLSSNLMELTPWSSSPQPRQDARFFLAISFLKPLPFTFSISPAAASPQESPADPPNLCFALCVLSSNLESLIVALHFASSTREKGTPDLASLTSLSFFGFLLVSLTSAGATASSSILATAFVFTTGAGASSTATSLGASSATRLRFFGLKDSLSSSGSFCAGSGTFVAAPPDSNQNWQREESGTLLSFLLLFVRVADSPSSPPEVSLSKAFRVLDRPLSKRNRCTIG